MERLRFRSKRDMRERGVVDMLFEFGGKVMIWGKGGSLRDARTGLHRP